jgi:hypothetical protein
LRLLLDETYSAIHAEALQTAGMHATTVLELGLAGSSDQEVFAVAIVEGFVLLTENVADFTRISAEHLLAGLHHPGILIALSSRFSRRPAGTPALVEAITGLAQQPIVDCLLYLRAPSKGLTSQADIAGRSGMRRAGLEPAPPD